MMQTIRNATTTLHVIPPPVTHRSIFFTCVNNSVLHDPKVLGIAVALKWVSSLGPGLRVHSVTLYNPNGSRSKVTSDFPGYDCV